MNLTSLLASLPQWGADAVVALGLLASLVLGVSNLASFVGTFWAPALAVSGACAKAVAWLHQIAGALASFLPATAEKRMAAKRAAVKVAAPLGLLLLVGSLSGCSWFQAHPAVAPDLQKVEVCVEGELVKDEAAGDTPITIGIDLGVTCGAAAVQVVEAALAKVAPVASVKSKAHVLLAAKGH